MSEIGVSKVSKSRTDIFVSNKNNSNKSSEEENDISMNSDVVVGTIIKDVDHDDIQKTVAVQQPDCTTTESTCMVNGVGDCITTSDDNSSSVCHSSCNEWIKLNVGGTYFQTTRTTLCSDRNSFFYRLLQDDSLNSEKDENGAYLIDRDPSYFAPILNFLRHGKLIINKDLNEDGVREEAEFYNVTSLIKMLDKRQTDHLNRSNDSSKNNHVYRLLHCCEGELSLAISTLSDGWKFEQLVPNFPNWTTDYFVVVSREYPIKR